MLSLVRSGLGVKLIHYGCEAASTYNVSFYANYVTTKGTWSIFLRKIYTYLLRS
jgi:hypothetical protein